MKLTYKGDYALKAVLDLAIHYTGDVVTIHDIAGRIDAPVKFLEQVLLDLKKGGFVESRRGKEGGYLLAREPGKITVGDVVRFIEGPLEPIACVKDGYTACQDVYKCVFRNIWRDVSVAVSGIVDHVTFEKLALKAGLTGQSFAYSI